MGTTHQEEAAFRLVIAHRSMLKAYVNALIRDPAASEDIFSDVILAIVRSWDRFDPTRPFPEWARGVAFNVAMAYLRREHRERRVVDEVVLQLVGGELDFMGDESHWALRQAALAKCMEKLSYADRGLIRLRYFENRSYHEIAESMGKRLGSIYTVFSRLHRALSRCVARQMETQ